jgi:hypothetical protein
MPDLETVPSLAPVSTWQETLRMHLEETCELPFGEVAKLAQANGIPTYRVLQEAEESGECIVDYETGHIRCSDAGI